MGLDQPRLAVRADASAARGSGHVARQFALCEAWVRRGGTATLVTGGAAHWTDRFRSLGVDVQPEPGAVAAADWWVVDGYDLPVPATDAPVLVVDDFGLGGERPATLVLDQNLGVGASTYPGAGDRLLGPRYALLRQEVRTAAAERSDEVGWAAGPVVVVVGGLPAPEVVTWAADLRAHLVAAGLTVEVLDGRRPMGEVLRTAAVAVAAAGSVCWELGHAGVPTAVVSVAENQRRLATALAAGGAAIDLGDVVDVPAIAAAVRVAALVDDLPRRSELAAAGRALVDGRGADRVATRLAAQLLRVRPAGGDDAERLWRWRNDPATRAASFNAEPVPWPDHLRWLEGRLASPETCRLLVVEAAGEPIGTARFDVAGSTAEISIAIDPAHRGRRLAAPAIDAACRHVRPVEGTLLVTAHVKPSNAASARAFEAADFDAIGPGAVDRLRYDRVLHGAA